MSIGVRCILMYGSNTGMLSHFYSRSLKTLGKHFSLSKNMGIAIMTINGLRTLAHEKGCYISGSSMPENEYYYLGYWEECTGFWQRDQHRFRATNAVEAREWLNSISPVRTGMDGHWLRKRIYLRDRSFSASIHCPCFGTDVIKNTLEIWDSTWDFNFIGTDSIVLSCDLRDRADHKQFDSEEQRYIDWWIGRLLCA